MASQADSNASGTPDLNVAPGVSVSPTESVAIGAHIDGADSHHHHHGDDSPNPLINFPEGGSPRSNTASANEVSLDLNTVSSDPEEVAEQWAQLRRDIEKQVDILRFRLDEVLQSFQPTLEAGLEIGPDHFGMQLSRAVVRDEVEPVLALVDEARLLDISHEIPPALEEYLESISPAIWSLIDFAGQEGPTYHDLLTAFEPANP
ncbi:hypothetical protein N7532_001014 [Penicillium argentinense]|uniref:Uncharacterized protein n=1 Tax=Penicillium argentinense TaxID=1131581 RepID=A0A9W9G1P0_9EURO|nr:uncharacterized protein N7532_001014 [Penicillium argentinense]KAJ5110479.1 hypothetical protein N7532_001014 [Penicillium argentinense]